MQPLLDVHVHSKHHGPKLILQDLSVQAQAGQILSLVGASGCGKSTLLRLIAGLDTDHRGHVRLEGHAQHGLTPDIGFIFQEPRLFPWLTVAQNVGFDVSGQGHQSPRVAELLNQVGLSGFEQALPKQLSGGQAQRVAIARGLFRRPRLLLLDEPFSAVDAFTRMKLQEVLLEVVRQHGLTVLIVTHDLDEAVYLSDRVVALGSTPGPALATLDIDLPRPRQRDSHDLHHARSLLLRHLHPQTA